MILNALKYENLSIWKWFTIIFSIALLTACTSAFFLFSLQLITEIRENNIWIIYGLPFAGIIIIYLYKKFGKYANKGNNLLLEEYYYPKGEIPWIMSPLILTTTLLTHLFGGSAGREGTAVQYGGTYGDRIASLLKLNKNQTRIALLAGIAAGFSSLFSTPLAGIFFAVEVIQLGKIRKKALPIIVLTSFLSYYICILLKAPHTHYTHISVENYFELSNLWIFILGVIFGLIARLFILFGSIWSKIFKIIKNEYVRITVGALVLLLLIYITNSTKYIGLGIPTILSSFETSANSYDFLLKIIFTTLTLSIGFKGGEVTPLFFIGATAASFLAIYIPLSLPLMVGLGFIAVFAGTTKTPFACALMALELFGWPIFPLALITALISVKISGRKGIYSSQKYMNWI